MLAPFETILCGALLNALSSGSYGITAHMQSSYAALAVDLRNKLVWLGETLQSRFPCREDRSAKIFARLALVFVKKQPPRSLNSQLLWRRKFPLSSPACEPCGELPYLAAVGAARVRAQHTLLSCGADAALRRGPFAGAQSPCCLGYPRRYAPLDRNRSPSPYPIVTIWR